MLQCSVYELNCEDGSITPLLGFVDEDIEEVTFAPYDCQALQPSLL